MVKIYSETIKSDFEGTIIDLETIGNFMNYADSRRYCDITPVIFGFIDKKEVKICCARSEETIKKLKQEIQKALQHLKKPFYAFNTDFERGVLFHHLSRSVEFEKELNLKKFEKKEDAVQTLNIPAYGDPFLGDGLSCSKAWLNRELDKAIAHNRSCLLKERDILLKRGFREPDKLDLVKL